jgi:hypothetical protein
MPDPRDIPISLVRIQHIIDRVHNRYPLVDKSDIVIVIKAFFETLRSALFVGDTIAIANMFSKMHLYHFSRIQNNRFSRVVKIKLTTSRKLKND